MKWQSNLSTILKCSKLFRSTLNTVVENEYHELLSKLLSIVTPLLIKNSNTNSILSDLIFSSLFQLYQNKIPYNNELKQITNGLNELQNKIDTKSKIKKSQHSIANLMPLPISTSNSFNFMNKLPESLLSKSMSFLDPFALSQLQIVSHKFLKSARKPTAINILTTNFFEKIYDKSKFSVQS
eukprot:105448_1